MKVAAFKPSKGIIIVLLDLLIIFATLHLVSLYALHLSLNYKSIEFWFLPITHVAVHALAGTYNQKFLIPAPRLPIRTFWVTIAAGMLYLFLYQTLSFTFLRPSLPVSSILAVVIIIGLLSTLIRVLVNQSSLSQEAPEEWLYLGYSSSAKRFLSDAFDKNPNQFIAVSSTQARSDLVGKNVLKHEALIELVANNNFSTIVIDPSFSPSDTENRDLIKQRMRGTEVFQLDEFYENKWFKVNIDSNLKHGLLLSRVANTQAKPSSLRIKRMLDVILSIFLLMLCLPVLIVIALTIKFTSQGPVFFSQNRVGLKSKQFIIYKFRTMTVDAEDQGAKWAKINDSRSTYLGHILRSTRLDELPQLWNVLHGDMSLVGPRPERPEFMDQLRQNIPCYDLRHLSKPGITGWAQVSFPYGASIGDSRKKLQYDLYYIKHQSLMFDVTVLVKTISIILRFEGR